MSTTSSAPRLLADIAERTVLSHIEAFLGLLVASGTSDLVDLSTLQSAAIAALPAGPGRREGCRRFPPRSLRHRILAPRQNRLP